MHALSTDSPEHERVIVALITISLALGWGLHVVLEAWKVVLPWWLDLTSVVSIYGVLHYLMDNHVWHWAFFRRLGIVSIPNLSGHWQGTVDSSYEDPATRDQGTKASVLIRQSWTRILIVLETTHSHSVSEAAMLIVNKGDPALSYEYENKPKSTATATMHAHSGNARLILKAQALDGSYYTGRDRETHGGLRLKKTRT